MAEITGQSVPSGLRYLYSGVLAFAVDWTQRQVVKKRQPWVNNKMKGGGIVVPDLTRGWGVTDAQFRVRRLFRRASYYFDWQTETGGVEPPAIGPRNKSWWWAAAKDSGMIYYNYFMQQTLILLLQGIIPDWCKLAVVEDASVFEEFPDQAERDVNQLHLDSRYAGKAVWTYIKTPYTGYYLYLNPNFFSPGYYTPYKSSVKIYATTNVWDQSTITWNNKPAVGDLLATVGLPQLGRYWSFIPPTSPAIVLQQAYSGQLLVFASTESAESYYWPIFNALEGYFEMWGV